MRSVCVFLVLIGLIITSTLVQGARFFFSAALLLHKSVMYNVTPKDPHSMCQPIEQRLEPQHKRSGKKISRTNIVMVNAQSNVYSRYNCVLVYGTFCPHHHRHDNNNAIICGIDFYKNQTKKKIINI